MSGEQLPASRCRTTATTTPATPQVQRLRKLDPQREISKQWLMVRRQSCGAASVRLSSLLPTSNNQAKHLCTQLFAAHAVFLRSRTTPLVWSSVHSLVRSTGPREERTSCAARKETDGSPLQARPARAPAGAPLRAQRANARLVAARNAGAGSRKKRTSSCAKHAASVHAPGAACAQGAQGQRATRGAQRNGPTGWGGARLSAEPGVRASRA